MALVPIIQPPIMRALTSQSERVIRMKVSKASVSYDHPHTLSHRGDRAHRSHRAEGPPADGHDHAGQLHESERCGYEAHERI